MEYTIVYTDDFLAHHGIKGMKWGVRKYQNKDGTLTEAGRKRYYNDDGSFTKRGEKHYKKYDKQVKQYQGMQKEHHKDLEDLKKRGLMARYFDDFDIDNSRKKNVDQWLKDFMDGESANSILDWARKDMEIAIDRTDRIIRDLEAKRDFTKR